MPIRRFAKQRTGCITELSEYRVAASGAWITGIIPNSPAAIADLREQDVITAVETTTLNGLSSIQINELIRGPKGQSISLTIQRQSQTLTKNVVRDQVIVPAIRWELWNPTRICASKSFSALRG